MIVWGTTILDQLTSGLLWFLFISIFSITVQKAFMTSKFYKLFFERSSCANHSDQTAEATLNCGLSSGILPQDTLALQV